MLGWTTGNDFSERTWQAGDRTLWRAKNADTFKPMGPWMVTNVELAAMTTQVRINGTPRNTFATGNMLFDAGDVISAISRYNTLSPGDVVWLGTDNVAQGMKPGDVIEIEITGVGILRSRVAAPPA